MNKLWLAAFLIGFSATVSAEGLCARGETTFFNCPVGGQKFASLCGQVSSKGSDWLQYRFGTRSKLELVYPEQKRGSLARFTARNVSPAHHNEDWISFTNNGATYSLVNYMFHDNRIESSVFSESSAGKSLTIKCNKTTPKQWKLFNHLGESFLEQES